MHLYVKKPLRHLPFEVDGLPGVGCRVKLLHAIVAVVALHLAAGEEAAATREKHLRRVADLTDAAEDTVVVFGDLNLRDAELAELTRRPMRLSTAVRLGFRKRTGTPTRTATRNGSRSASTASLSVATPSATRTSRGVGSISLAGRVSSCRTILQ